MSALPLFDAAGRRRSPATMPGYHAGREPRNKGRTYPADPPTVDEIVAVMRQAGEDRHGLRTRALIVVLWRAALRIQEALSLAETDLDANRCSVLVQHGKGRHRREVGMDMWAFTALRPWLSERAQLPVGPLFCVIDGPTRGARAWSSAAVRAEFRRLAADAGVRRRFAPHQLRHAHAVELAREGVPPSDSAATARTPEHGDHQHLPVRDRHRRGHRNCRVPAGADDVCHRRTSTLNRTAPLEREPGAAPALGARNARSRSRPESDARRAHPQTRQPFQTRGGGLLVRASGSQRVCWRTTIGAPS